MQMENASLIGDRRAEDTARERTADDDDDGPLEHMVIIIIALVLLGQNRTNAAEYPAPPLDNSIDHAKRVILR